MNNLLRYIVFLFFLFKSLVCSAQPLSLPDDFVGANTRARLAAVADDEASAPSAVEVGLIMFEIGRYFEQKYPDSELFSDDMAEKLKPFFPNDNEYELHRHLTFLQTSVSLYRAARSVYNKYISEKLAPDSYKQVHSFADFDQPDEVKYQEAPEGEFIKVYNFKKFLTYSNNPKERQAIEDFKKIQSGELGILDKINYAVRNTDWKKFIFQIGYRPPFVSDKGIGEYHNSDFLKARLLSDTSHINNKKEINIGLHLTTLNNYFILANNISPTLQKPSLKFKDSENLESYEVNYPVPLKNSTLPFAHKYFGDFLIPITIKVKDVSKPLDLNLKAKLNVCNGSFECLPEDLNLHLHLSPFGTEIFENGYQNYFNKNIALLPSATPMNFELKKFVIDTDEKNQSLRLEFKVDKQISTFNVFIEEKDGYTLFSAPLISIHDNMVYVRFYPLSPSADLTNNEFIITAVLNTFDAYRTTKIAEKASLFDTQNPNLNFAFILLAVLGGFILNFMPCVFPVLSLKAISLSHAQKSQKKKLKKSLFYNVLGIFSGFTLLIVFLLFSKYLGYSLGWGMQYQNIEFLVIMSFAVTGIIVILPQLQNIKFISSEKYGKKINFLIGNLTVLLSTPCTGPYLATAIGFALCGTYIDIIVILYAVALGLSLPYLLIMCPENPQLWLPPAGNWTKHLQTFANIMLYLTIVWFMSLIFSQTGLLSLFVLLICILVFALSFVFYNKFNEYLSIEKQNYALKKRLRRYSLYTLLAILFVCVGISFYTADRGYTKNLRQNQENRQTVIDKQLIADKLNKGHSVLLEIGADWCLTCRYNSLTALNSLNLKEWNKSYRLDFIRVDWTNYDEQTLNFMAKYGRKGLPFYILYTPILRDGLVLPEIFSSSDFEKILLSSVPR